MRHLPELRSPSAADADCGSWYGVDDRGRVLAIGLAVGGAIW